MLIESVAVIGAGTMGSGIAQWFAQRHIPTTLCDNNPIQAANALSRITQTWQQLVEKGKLSPDEATRIKACLHVAPIDEIASETSLVIEAIIEDLNIKQALFQQLDSRFSRETILASNTSSFSITELAKFTSTERQQRFVGLHFFNPATHMKLVEIINAQQTDNSITTALYQWFESQGKEPAICLDTPGFIVNRVARSFYGEALRIAQHDEEALFNEIDRLMKTVGAFKMGPFELMDLIGVEVNLAVTTSVWEAHHRSARFTPHPLQQKLVSQGRLGRKAKKGFYRYE